MKSYVSRDALCPYYHREDTRRLLCEGPAPGVDLQLCFTRRKGYEDYRRRYCCRDWDRCLVAQTLERKYDRRGRLRDS